MNQKSECFLAMKLDDTQRRSWEWLNKNWDCSDVMRVALRQSLGIVEEIGELSEAIDDLDIFNMADAIGDCINYALNLLSAFDIKASEILGSMPKRIEDCDDDSGSVFNVLEAFNVASKICNHVLKFDQGIKKDVDHVQEIKELMPSLFFELEEALFETGYPESFGMGIVDTVREVVDEVVLRDWVNHPNDAREIAHEKFHGGGDKVSGSSVEDKSKTQSSD